MFHKIANKKIQVFITGGPRSGTSFLSGLVGLMGFSHGNKKSLKGADINNRYGYFENVNLMQIEEQVLNYIPKIKTTVKRDKIEVYKGNRLMVISELFAKAYPNAKWLYIDRNPEATFKSRFGENLSYDEWITCTNSSK